MGKAITVRGKTVEQAVEAALDILCLDLSDVHIHVNQRAESNSLAPSARFAEVIVTPVRYPTVITDRPKENVGKSGVRIIDGRVEAYIDETGDLPTIEAGSGVQVIVNGEKKEGVIHVSEEDTVHLRTIDELTRAQLSITVREQGALALLSVTPGKKISRSIRDAFFTTHLIAEAEAVEETINDLSQQMIREACEQIGITALLDKRVLWEACETAVPYEGIIARGTFPKAGLPGDVEVQIDVNGGTLKDGEKIDYRERATVQFVKEGQLVATVLPPVAGQSGRDVFGNDIPAEIGEVAIVRLGKNVLQTGTHIFAQCSGKLSVERKNGIVSIDVSDIIELEEVDLASGNIRFDGDVTIRGNVSQGCAVEVTGCVLVNKDVRKAEVKAEKAIDIHGQVSSSVIEVGQPTSADASYACELEKLIPQLEILENMIQSIARLRGTQASELEGIELNKMFRLAFGAQYESFQEGLQTFLSLKIVSEDEQWKTMQVDFYNLFVNTLHPGVQSGEEFLQLIRSARAKSHEYRQEFPLKKGELLLPYAVNSTLTCSGTIRVSGSGLAQCTVHAFEDLIVEGVCRGGELTGERSVSIRESGSKNGVQTTIRTNEEGTIVIGIAHPGTTLVIGKETCHLTELCIGITAKLQDGHISIR